MGSTRHWVHLKVEIVAHIRAESGLIVLDEPLAGVRVTLPPHLLVPVAAAARCSWLRPHGCRIDQAPALWIQYTQGDY